MKDETFISLTALGQIYGVAAQDVGRWLKGLSLRNEDGRPTRTAIEEGYVRDTCPAYPGSHWHWHEEKTCYLLDMMGYKRGGVRGEMEVYDGFVLIRGG